MLMALTDKTYPDNSMNKTTRECRYTYMLLTSERGVYVFFFVFSRTIKCNPYNLVYVFHMYTYVNIMIITIQQ